MFNPDQEDIDLMEAIQQSIIESQYINNINLVLQKSKQTSNNVTKQDSQVKQHLDPDFKEEYPGTKSKMVEIQGEIKFKNDNPKKSPPFYTKVFRGLAIFESYFPIDYGFIIDGDCDVICQSKKAYSKMIEFQHNGLRQLLEPVFGGAQTYIVKSENPAQLVLSLNLFSRKYQLSFIAKLLNTSVQINGLQQKAKTSLIQLLCYYLSKQSSIYNFKETKGNQQLTLKLKQLFNGQIPENLFCPITKCLFFEPVTASDGFTYERSVIQQWFQSNDISPMTGEYLDQKYIFLNQEIAEKLNNFNSLFEQK